MDQLKINEYRLEFVEAKGEKFINVEYFDSTAAAYDYITKNRIYTFKLTGEIHIASRHDVEALNEES